MPNFVKIIPCRIEGNISSVTTTKVASLNLPTLNGLYNVPDGDKLTSIRPGNRALSHGKSPEDYARIYAGKEELYRVIWDRVREAEALDTGFVAALIMRMGLFKDLPLYLIRDNVLSPKTQARFKYSSLEYQTGRSFINKFYLMKAGRVTTRPGVRWNDIEIDITAPLSAEMVAIINKQVKSI